MTNGQWPPENMLARRVSEAQLSGQEIARSCWARNQGCQSLLEQLLLSQPVLNPWLNLAHGDVATTRTTIRNLVANMLSTDLALSG